MSSFIIFLVAGIDLLLKAWVEREIPFREDRMIVKDKIILRKVHNKGMMLNMAEKHPKCVKWISAIVTLLTAFTQKVISKETGYEKIQIALALVLGGAISNTYDRIRRGYVVDYLAFCTKNKKNRRITYNIGDFAIFTGVFLLIILSFGKEK